MHMAIPVLGPFSVTFDQTVAPGSSVKKKRVKRNDFMPVGS